MIKIDTKPTNGVVVNIDSETSYVFNDMKKLCEFMNAIFRQAEINSKSKAATEEPVKAEKYETFTDDGTVA